MAWLAAPLCLLPQAALATPAAVLQVLGQGRCRGCDLILAGMAQAQLTRADLELAKLEGATLSGAQLDGANLSRSDLSFASLNGASLRGANLVGARLDPSDLATAHWQGAKGLNPALSSYGELHSAGRQAAQLGRYPEAEQWFNEAIRRNPEAAIRWLARGITRVEQGEKELVAKGLAFAGNLYGAVGDQQLEQELRQASEAMAAPERKSKGGNGSGSALLSGGVAAFQLLTPLALKTFMPVGL